MSARYTIAFGLGLVGSIADSSLPGPVDGFCSLGQAMLDVTCLEIFSLPVYRLA